MFKQLWSYIKNALVSVMPVTLALFLLHGFGIIVLSGQELILFSVGALFLIIGLVLFNIGLKQSLLPVGEMVGSSFAKIRNLPLLILIIFFLGLMVTAAEPSLSIFANQSPMNPTLIILAVSIGVGLFLVFGITRIIFNKSFNIIVITTIALIFALLVVVLPEFVPTAFDTMGVATGVVTVPFIMALGKGVATTRAKEKAQESSFGLIGLAILGPVLCILLLGVFSPKPDYIPAELSESMPVWKTILLAIKDAAINNAIVLTPIILFFVIYQSFVIKLSKKRLLRMGIGAIYLFFGLLFFLSGASFGYVPIGNTVGEVLAQKDNNVTLVLVITLLGGLATIAEPSVHVLGEQVEEVSDGTISKTTIVISLALGSAVAMALASLRLIYDFSYVYIIIPGYIIAILLTFVVPNIYTTIAFDGGGAVSGALVASFLAPIVLGVASGFDRNPLLNGLGMVGLLAMMPLITIQILGFGAVIRQKAAVRINRGRQREVYEEEIIYFD
ncbi:MAG: DUF1538 domain-containing protein [Bacilli bacterium]|jgi:hypothetical protein